jgi:hypothetical protein
LTVVSVLDTQPRRTLISILGGGLSSNHYYAPLCCGLSVLRVGVIGHYPMLMYGVSLIDPIGFHTAFRYPTLLPLKVAVPSRLSIPTGMLLRELHTMQTW